MKVTYGCEDYSSTETQRRERSLTCDMSRRGFMTSLSLGLVSWMAGNSLAQVQVGGKQTDRILVVIFLRGGADGLNMVVPYRDDNYHRQRPTLRMVPPSEKQFTVGRRVLDLNGEFGLHPALSGLLPLYREGKMAIVPACGSNDRSRSHFEAMATMERGMDNPADGLSSGWLGRVLSENPLPQASPLRSLAFGFTMPDAMRGAPAALSLESIKDFKLDAPKEFIESLRKEYAEGADAISDAGRQTFAVLDRLNSLKPSATSDGGKKMYPDSDLGRSLQEVAMLVRGDFGLEYAYLDKDGWDTHVTQGADLGWHQLLCKDLADSVAAFTQDLGTDLDRVTIVIQTEFGRRVGENQGLGTDHGRASNAYVIGGGVKGGRIVGRWPGLGKDQVDSVGDLRVANDYRTVLNEVLTQGMGVKRTPFRNLQTGQLGLYTA